MMIASILMLAPQSLLSPTANGLRIAGNGTVPWTIVFVLTFITLIPAILLSVTPMVRLLVVFHFLRQALGTQTAPSNQILMGLGLMMTWFLMHPVLIQVDRQAVEPFRQGKISGMQAIELGAEPPKKFMLHYAREKDLALFASATMEKRPAKAEDLPLRVVVPAYMLSELKAGFQIGAVYSCHSFWSISLSLPSPRQSACCSCRRLSFQPHSKFFCLSWWMAGICWPVLC